MSKSKVTKVAGAVAKATRAVQPANPHRNLNSLRALAEAKMGVKRSDTYRVVPTVLQIEPGFNVRVGNDPELREHINSIKQSIREYITRDDPDNRHCELIPSDLIPDLIIRVTDEGDMFLVDGHCRTTAIRELIEEGFVIDYVGVKATSEDRKGRVMIMLRSAQGKNLAPIERAKGFVELSDEGMGFHEIARFMGNITPQRVEQLVLLGRAPEGVRRLIEDKKVTADSALEVIRKHRETPEEAERILTDLVSGKQGSSDRPVGKGETRVSIPKKAQEGIFKALVSESKGLAKQIKALESKGAEGWEEELVNVNLPAGVVKEILERQARQAGKGDETAEGGAA